jgi:hypothetical protein
LLSAAKCKPKLDFFRRRVTLGYMSATIIKETLARRPFEPFRIRLSSGDAYDVRHPENALLVKSGIYVALPDERGELPEVAAWCSFLHVAAIEPLNAATRN